MGKKAIVHFGIYLCCCALLTSCLAREDQSRTAQDEAPSAAAPGQETVVLVSDPYPPYVLDGPEGAQGYVTDAALLIFQEAGCNAVYKNVPYERALAGLDQGEYSGLLAVAPGRENYTYPKGKLGSFENRFFTRKDSEWQWEGRKSLDGLVLSAVKGYGYDDDGVIDTYLAEHEGDLSRVDLAYGVQPLAQNLKKLNRGRVDLVFGDSLALWYTADQLGMSGRIREVATYTDETVERIVVGFNLNHPKAQEYADIMSRGIQQIKASGEFEAILKSYHLQDHIQE